MDSISNNNLKRKQEFGDEGTASKKAKHLDYPEFVSVIKNFAEASFSKEANHDRLHESMTHFFSRNITVNTFSPSSTLEGYTPFLCALITGQIPLAEQILKIHPGVNVNAKIETGPFESETPLWIAARQRQWDLVKEILKTHPEANVNAQLENGPNKGATPLWLAAKWEQWDLVKEILKTHPEANVNAQLENGSNKGLTLLWLAANSEQWDLVKEILKAHPEANVNTQPDGGPNKGLTLVWMAAIREKWDLVKEILKTHPEVNVNATIGTGPNKGLNLLWFATRWEQWDLVEEILKTHPKVNVNAQTETSSGKGRTSLWMAAIREKWDLVEIMLRVCKKPDLRALSEKFENSYFKNHLSFAAEQPHTTFADFSVLTMAKQANKPDIIRQILSKKVKFNVVREFEDAVKKGNYSLSTTLAIRNFTPECQLETLTHHKYMSEMRLAFNKTMHQLIPKILITPGDDLIKEKILYHMFTSVVGYGKHFPDHFKNFLKSEHPLLFRSTYDVYVVAILSFRKFRYNQTPLYSQEIKRSEIMKNQTIIRDALNVYLVPGYKIELDKEKRKQLVVEIGAIEKFNKELIQAAVGSVLAP